MKFENIRALREDLEISQKEIAQRLGMAQNTYSQYETGVTAWTDALLLRLADFYGVSVDYLLNRTKRKEPYPPDGK